jgi:hypothetical protein
MFQLGLQAVFAMKRLGLSTCSSLIVQATAEPAPCAVFAVLDYL